MNLSCSSGGQGPGGHQLPCTGSSQRAAGFLRQTAARRTASACGRGGGGAGVGDKVSTGRSEP